MKNIKAIDLKRGLEGAYNLLESNKEYVNGLNVFPVPDGDTGTNMSLTFKSVIKKLNESNTNTKAIAKALSTGSLMGARGNSGVILSQLCRGAASIIEKVENLEIINLVEALEAARDTAYKAVLKPTEGTILTVARMMAEFARREFLKFDNILEFLEAIVSEGKIALNKTPEMLPVLKEAEVVDAGGQGLMFLIEGFLKILKGEEIESNFTVQEVKTMDIKDKISHHSDVKPEDIVFGYCTEFLINHDGNASVEEFKDIIQQFGNSLVVVGADNLIKTHIHTDDPGKVLSMARQRGELSDIKIENMRFQNAEVNRKRDEQDKKAKKEAKKKYGFVTVTIGEGFDQIFSELNVDKLIKGGQTMNPSTEDIVEAINEVNAENVFIFPNNKNIVLAAKQAIDLVESNLIVIETHSIPQAFTALINFDESLNPEENKENMVNSLKEITSLQLTYAVRDTKTGELNINQGDYIGLKDGKIVEVGSKIDETMKNLVKQAVTEESAIISLYYGEDISEEDAAKLQEELEKEYPSIDIEIYYGGQPLYYYIASVE